MVHDRRFPLQYMYRINIPIPICCLPPSALPPPPIREIQAAQAGYQCQSTTETTTIAFCRGEIIYCAIVCAVAQSLICIKRGVVRSDPRSQSKGLPIESGPVIVNWKSEMMLDVSLIRGDHLYIYSDWAASGLSSKISKDRVNPLS